MKFQAQKMKVGSTKVKNSKKVPVKEGIFKEPMTREMGSFGNKIIPAGV